ncbi:hypothetical protein HOD08_00595 [bacterium]|nr:hypothetical protein [bacterium]
MASKKIFLSASVLLLAFAPLHSGNWLSSQKTEQEPIETNYDVMASGHLDWEAVEIPQEQLGTVETDFYIRCYTRGANKNSKQKQHALEVLENSCEKTSADLRRLERNEYTVIEIKNIMVNVLLIGTQKEIASRHNELKELYLEIKKHTTEEPQSPGKYPSSKNWSRGRDVAKRQPTEATRRTLKRSRQTQLHQPRK